MALTKVPHSLDSTIATTQAASDNSTNIATTAYVTTAIANLVDGAPSTLNTLDEIAAALNDDAALNTTLTNSIATKLPLAGGTLTGDLGINQAASGYGNLTVGGTGVIVALRASSGAGKLGFYEGGAGRQYIETLNGADGIRFVDGNGSTEHMRIDSEGYVRLQETGKTHHSSYLGFITPNGGVISEDTGTASRSMSFVHNAYVDSGNQWTFMHADEASLLQHYNGATSIYNSAAGSADGTITWVERFRVHPNGNVGIGTSSPAQKLHVSAGSGASTAVQFGEAYDTYVKIKATNTASAMLNFMNTSDTTVWSLGYRNNSDDGFFRIRKAATLDSGGHRYDFDAGGSFSIVPNNAAAGLYITASGSGNDSSIVMGTALNSRGFYVDDDSTNRMKFYTGYGKAVANREIIMNNDGDLAIGAGRRFYLDGESDTYITEYSANEIGFYTGGAQRVKISGGHLYSNNNIYSGTSSTGGAYTLNSQTTHGSWGVGCHNSSYAHHTTDRGTYYWNTRCEASGGFHTYSDENLKKEITTIGGALDSVAKMNGVTFKWKDPENRGGGDTGKQFGVIAQNMLEVDSELPQLNDDPLSPEETRESDDSFYTMDYSRLTPYFIEAIKELKTKLEAAEARITELES